MNSFDKNNTIDTAKLAELCRIAPSNEEQELSELTEAAEYTYMHLADAKDTPPFCHADGAASLSSLRADNAEKCNIERDTFLSLSEDSRREYFCVAAVVSSKDTAKEDSKDV